MQIQKMKDCLVLFLCLGFGAIQAQEAIGSSGGDATGSGGSAAFTIGQVVYTKVSGSNGSALQGVQQPYEIFSVGTITAGLDINLSVFPNPTYDIITLQIKDLNRTGLDYHLFDLKGKLLGSSMITSVETSISLNYLPAATYFLTVVHENITLQTFKIIKNK